MIAVWSWVVASPQNAIFVISILTAVFNIAVRFFTSKAWGDFAAKHPRIAGVFLFFKAAFPDAGGMLKALFLAITGEIKRRAGVIDAPSPSVAVEPAKKPQTNSVSNMKTFDELQKKD